MSESKTPTQTPRTDKAWESFSEDNYVQPLLEHARTLELELNEARQHENECADIYEGVLKQLTTAQQEVAELKRDAAEREKWWNQTIINAMARMQEAVSYVAQFSKDSAMKETKK